MMRFRRCQWATVLGLLALACCQRTAKSYLERGNRLFREDKFEEAELNYRNSVKRSPSFGEAHYRLALTELKLGQQVLAYEELIQATQFARDREDIRIDLANVSVELLNSDPHKSKVLYDQVKNVADSLLRTNANSFDGLRLQADLLTVDGNLTEALALFQKADHIKPHEPTVAVPMLQVMLQLKQVADVERLSKDVIRTRKDARGVYDLLFKFYIRANRMSEAEDLLKSEIASIPKDPAPVLQLASLYKQLQRAPAMVETLQRLVGNPQDFPRAHGIVGDFYADNGNVDDAIREYRLGLGFNAKDNALYQEKIVKVLIAEGKRDEAIEQLSRVLKENPDDSDSRLARAILLRGSNDPKKLEWAILELSSLIQRLHNDDVAHYNLGLAYLAKGDSNLAKGEFVESARLRPGYIAPRKALADIDQRERNYSETLRLTHEILATNPDDQDARLLHAAALLGSKSYQEARNELTALLQQYPNSESINLHLAVLDVQEQKYREAESRYHQLYKPGSKDLRPLEGFIYLYIAERQPDKALALLEQEAKHSPDSRPVHLLLASAATNAGKLDLAMQQYQWLQVNDADSPLVYESLGDFYQLKGDVHSALDSYQRAKELVPNDPKIIAMIAFLQDTSGKEIEAISNLQKQLEIDPQDTVAMNNLAFTLADTSTNLDRALQLAESAERKAPNDPGVEDTLGWVYVKKGLNDSAIQIFSGLVNKYPDEPAFRYHLGVALLQKGELQEAKAEFVISLSRNPPKEIAAKIKLILSTLG